MYINATQHVEPLRIPDEDDDVMDEDEDLNGLDSEVEEDVLDVPLLVRMAEATLNLGHSNGESTAADHQKEKGKGKAKRTTDDMDEDIEEEEGEGSVRKRPRMSPSESLQPTADAEILVLQHTFSLAYTLPPTPTLAPQIASLLALLKSHPNNSVVLPARLDLAKRILTGHYDRLCSLPPLPFSDSEEDDGDVGDVWAALYVLGALGRVRCETALQLVFAPGEEEEGVLPFRLHLTLTASLLTPAIYAPIQNHVKEKGVARQTKRGREAGEDAQRRFLGLVFPPAPPAPLSSADTPRSASTYTDIPYLYSVLAPAPALSQGGEERMQPEGMVPKLLPFQRRSVGWMLGREGVLPADVTSSSAHTEQEQEENSLFCDKTDAGWLNRLTGNLSPLTPFPLGNNEHQEQEGEDQEGEAEGDLAKGGILAEEPGLGKTLETLAVVLLNPRGACKDGPLEPEGEGSGDGLMGVKTTLIVTPPALAPQWADEIARHAPGLKVFVYEGWAKLRAYSTGYGAVPASRKGKGKAKAGPHANAMDVDSSSASTPARTPAATPTPDSTWPAFINGYDVCITTYTHLRADLDVARPIPQRPRRADVVYGPRATPRSPLVRCGWWRVVMDEVQVVGAGRVEEMVSLIPRVSSWAVSGTPARAQVADLMHVLRFLRIAHHVEPPRVWARLLTPAFAPQFAELFRRVSIRTLKASVKDELTIPQQTRFLVPVVLGPVERHIYDQALEAALLELGLDARGVAASVGWEIDAGLLRTVLRRLRGICTHPQVGQLKQKPDKVLRGGGKGLKSIGEVLDGMRDHNWRTLMDDRKLRVQTFIRRAQLQQHQEGNRTRYQGALETLLAAEQEADKLIAEVERAMAEHEEAGETLKAAHPKVLEATTDTSTDGNEKGKGKTMERDGSPDSDDWEDHDMPKTPAGVEHGIKKRALRQRLRESRVVLHRVKFLQGDVYHVLGGTHAGEEDKAYAVAEEIRRDLLKTTEDGATRAMAILLRDADAKGLTKDSLLLEVPFLTVEGGEKSVELIDDANDIIENLLNAQSELLWEWRDRMHALLTQSLKSDNAEGDEYAKSIDSQGEADMYLQAYTFLMADRRAALIAERTLLAEHDSKEKKLRKTKAAQDAAAAAAEMFVPHNPDLPEDFELRPEHEVLFKDLTTTRRDLLLEFEGKAIKSIVVELNAINLKLKDTHPEKDDISQALTTLRKLITDQGHVMEKLEADVAQFRKAFNERILYFRQLQEISDSVAEVTWDDNATEAIERCDQEKLELEVKINTNRARQRFLNHLAENGTMDDDDDGCILCRCEFQRGYITPCAHIFCEPCMNAWIVKKDGKTCPVCRVLLKPEQLQRFTAKDQKPDAPAAPKRKELAPKMQKDIQYNKIDPTLLENIQTMDSLGSYGSKIEVLVQHLLYLQLTDPGAKSIVFSAWADSLQIIEHALNRNKIPCLKIDQSKGGQNGAKRFVSDPSLLVLLLHGERENAGLNITCASRVFLVESVVHHGFEVQAIARIDRMGQTRPTEVYCYYAEDTVEKNILDLAARQGLSLYTEENSAGTLNTTAFALDAEKKADAPSKKKNVQKGDFILKTDDMLAILFPHMYFYEDYMDVSEGDEAGGLGATVGSSSHIDQIANAVAGPSRRN